MEEVLVNELTHDGMRRVKLIGDVPFDGERPVAALWRHGVYVAEMSVGKRQVRAWSDAVLSLHYFEMVYPVYGPCEVMCFGEIKLRRLMFVNFAYAAKVSECIELAKLEFFAGTHFAPRDAFVRELPKQAELWMDVHGLILHEAEWMPAKCVAVGGRSD
jgi:hypothetical protein